MLFVRMYNQITVGFLIIDDSLSKKDNSTKKIEGLDYHHSHSDGKTHVVTLYSYFSLQGI